MGPTRQRGPGPAAADRVGSPTHGIPLELRRRCSSHGTIAARRTPDDYPQGWDRRAMPGAAEEVRSKPGRRTSTSLRGSR